MDHVSERVANWVRENQASAKTVEPIAPPQNEMVILEWMEMPMWMGRRPAQADCRCTLSSEEAAATE